MKNCALKFSGLLALAAVSAWAQTNKISSVAIGTSSTAGGTANGVALVTERIGTALNQPGSVGNNLAGIQYVPGQIPLDGSPASIAFFTLTGATIPGGAGNPATAFTSYGTLTSPTAVTTYIDVASKLTADSYSGLTFAEADLGAGSRDFYAIHHRPGTDYFAQIVPGTGIATLIRDLKPMSWAGPTAGGPANVGLTGYFGLAWATGILSAGAPYVDQSIYYLRNDASSPSHTKFGVMVPALTGASSDTLDLTTAVGSFGVGGYTTLAFSPAVIGNYGANQFYYLRQDTGTGGTGNTILGRLNPSLVAGVRTISDIANLGGVFNTLNFAADATGPAGAWGTTQFYVTGALVSGAQSISFEAIPDHNVGDVFTITPTASSNLDIDVTVVSGPATVATTGVSGATPSSLRVFTITTTNPGIVTLRATQAGRSSPLPAYASNMLQQSFNVRGLPTVTSANSAAATVGTAFTFNITATGSPTSYTASPLPSGLAVNSATGVITGTPSTAGSTVVSVTATNATGTSPVATLTITTSSAGVAPIITSPTSAPATAGAAFSYNIVATGVPTSYAATGLPAGLTLNSATGAISGTPTTAGTSVVTLTATNSSGTSSATLTITVAAASVAPVITSPTTAPGTVGTPFTTYLIAATGLPTSYSATGLPPGLTLNSVTGAISGTPTVAGTSVVTLTATNSSGSSNATLTVTVAGANVAPIITSPPTAPGTVGTPFTSYLIAATGSPTTYTATGLPAGLTLNSVTGAINGTPTVAGTSVVTLTATNSSGTTSATLTITVAGASVAPIITSPPTALGTVSTPFTTYLIAATGLPTSYTATGLPAGLTLNTLTGAINGTPTVSGGSVVTITATNAIGTSTASLTISIAGPPSVSTSGIVNFSIRAISGTGSQTLIMGFIVAGDGLNLLVRGMGPGLASYGVSNVLADPVLSLFDGSQVVATNDNWQTPVTIPVAGALPPSDGTQIAATTARIGASPLPNSKDSALLFTANHGAHTTSLLSSNGTAGVALTEIFVTNNVAGTRLFNVSGRTNVSGGEGTLIAGLIIAGNTAKTVVIRGVGPSLAVFGVTGVLADPMITVYSGSAQIATNDNWDAGPGSAAALIAASARIGAFPLPAGSKDASLLVTLQPGAYTVLVTGVGNTTGVALIEIYDAD